MSWQTIIPWGVALVLGGIALWVFFRSRAPKENHVMMLLQQQLTNLHDQLTQHLQRQSSEWQKTHEVVGSRLDNAARVVADLTQRFGRVEEATKRVFDVGKDIASLQEILRAPKLRGNVSEQFLADLLAQMLPQDHYELQYEFKNGERVDAIIKTAHGIVSVDAKFPLENFQRVIAAKTEEEKTPFRKLFANDVKKHVDDISKKYIRPGEGTFDFALMYIPAENVYYEIIARDDATGESASLAAHAMKKRVVAVSPSTFYAYLNTILLGLRGLRVERFAKEILKDMERIKTEVARFTDDFSTVGKHLGNAASAYDKAEKRLERIGDRLTTFEDPDTALSETSTPESLPEKPAIQ